MMFVSGDVRHPLPETSALVEAIVKQQALETLHRASLVAARRASRMVTNEDILFVIRHDRMKLSRVAEYLGWYITPSDCLVSSRCCVGARYVASQTGQVLPLQPTSPMTSIPPVWMPLLMLSTKHVHANNASACLGHCSIASVTTMKWPRRMVTTIRTLTSPFKTDNSVWTRTKGYERLIA